MWVPFARRLPALLIRLPDYVFWSCYRLSIDLSRVLQAEGPGGLRARLHDLELLNPLLAQRWRAYLRARSVVSLSDRKQPAYREARLLRGPAPDPLETINRANTAALVRASLKRLPDRAAKILRLRYGLDGDRQTLEQIGQLLNLTRERVRQIQQRAEERLRRLLGAEAPPAQPLFPTGDALADESRPDNPDLAAEPIGTYRESIGKLSR
jgi:RNA polymerase sigma factor (sigma-70 family)